MRALFQSALLAMAVLAAASCETTEVRRPVPHEPVIIRHAQALRAWRVEHEGEVLGQIVYFPSAESAEYSQYVVRNPFGQDLGWIDGLGRAYRLLPHHRDPAWVGTGTVARGAERILDVTGPITLVEDPLVPAPQGR